MIVEPDLAASQTIKSSASSIRPLSIDAYRGSGVAGSGVSGIGALPDDRSSSIACRMGCCSLHDLI